MAPPNEISDVLRSTLGLLHLKKQVERYGWLQHWSKVVGEDLAKVTAPEKLTRSNVLIVKVTSAALAQELTLRKMDFLSRISEQVPDAPAVCDMRFIAGDPKAIEKRARDK